MEYKRANPLGWVMGDLVAFKGRVIVPCPPEPTDYEKNVSWLETAEFVTANCACPVEVLHRTGGFDESFTMAWREDSDFQFKLLEEGIPVVVVAAARVVHPVRKAYWGISLKEQKKSLFNALLYKKHPELFRKKIYQRPFWNYYSMLGLLLTSVVALLMWRVPLAIMAATAWLIMTLDFARKRLRGTSHSAGHVAEMVLTSMAIPVLSVYWTIYGAIRYKTFFL
jgi:GT2 family glycosyltransferase